MNKIEQAKQVLKDAGYFTDNLWHIQDVQNNHKVSEEEAYEILGSALTSEYIVSETFAVINDVRIDRLYAAEEE
jgi:hypothetical protein